MSTRAANIAGRMNDFYTRQRAWLRESISALDTILAAADEPDYDRWVAEDAVRAQRLRDLLAEHSALRKEWDAATGLTAAEREGIAGIAREVDQLRVVFGSRTRAATERLTRALDGMKGEAGDMRRGREGARRYGTGSNDDGAMVDRRA